MRNRVSNELYYDDAHAVWRLTDGGALAYSDGTATEIRLARVLKSARDLSSTSSELEQHIVDWPTEYHLSPKRSQLLRDLQWDRSQRVLEVGCGCGAITRFLGETFDDVVAVEGSPTRAAIARLRTRDQGNVSILCAPFQNVRFRDRFDVVFCIGVFEYSGLFVEAENPYAHILEHLSSILSDNGVLVLAIENQFGLKYLASSTEDHSGIMFDGIEGYHRRPRSARTFGYGELRQYLSRHFPSIEFYFPYPDYKLPSCIVTEELLSRVDASELIGSYPSRDYAAPTMPLFDERLALGELARNGAIPFFANSFLVVAGKGAPSVTRDWLAVIYGTDRRPEFRTKTVVLDAGDHLAASKVLLSGKPSESVGRLSLAAGVSRWVDGESLQMQLVKRLRQKHLPFHEILDATLPWYRKLHALSWEESGVRWVDGQYLDAIWRNTFLHQGNVTFIDLEWVWAEPVRLSFVVMRALWHLFRGPIHRPTSRTGLRGFRSMRGLIDQVFRFYGLPLTQDDLRYFVEMESELQAMVLGTEAQTAKARALFRWGLVRKPGSQLRGLAVRRVLAGLRRYSPIRLLRTRGFD